MKINGIPAEFPLEPKLGAVPGVQPKLLVCQVAGQYVAGRTADEYRERYLACEDLARQLYGYCKRKAQEHPEWSRGYNLERTAKGLAQKVAVGVWDVSADEQAWVMQRVAVLWSEA